MTTTTLINAVSIGTPSRASNITLHTFNASSGAFSLQAAVTAGALSSPNRPIIHYAPVADALAATIAGVKIADTASDEFEANVFEPVQQKIFTTDLIACRGRYLLVWVEEPSLPATATLTVKVTEF